jgi:acid stress chaperone HdeB
MGGKTDREEHSMKLNHVLSGLVFVLVTLAAPVSQAQLTVDLAKITCKQYPLMKVNPDYIALWLSGYYNGKRDNTVIDIERLKETAKKVKRECLYNNQGTVMQAVEKLLSSEK